MKLIVGLGNPRAKYQNNRHNIGYMVLDEFATSDGISWRQAKNFLSYWQQTRPFMLVKPTTFVNQSGQVVREIVSEHAVKPEDMLIVHDELDLDFGKIRLSFGGSAAGHHGVESVIKGLSTGDFARLRVGIGSPSANGSEYVLEDFNEQEKRQLPDVLARCQEAIRSYIDDGLGATMNRFN